MQIIPFEVRETLSKAGIKVDMFGQSLSVGDLVLCKSYGSPCHDILATIKRVNKVNLVIDVDKHSWDRAAIDAWRQANPGQYWWSLPNHKRASFRLSETIEMSRKPYDVIKFDKQATVAEQSYQDIQNQYPELFI